MSLTLASQYSDLHKSLYMEFIKFIDGDDAYDFATLSTARIKGAPLCSR